MLRDLAPATAGVAIELVEEPSDEQAAAFYAAAREDGFAFALDAADPVAEECGRRPRPALSLLDVAEAAEKKALSAWAFAPSRRERCDWR